VLRMRVDEPSGTTGLTDMVCQPEADSVGTTGSASAYQAETEPLLRHSFHRSMQYAERRSWRFQ
jgi:hypothetical protein